MLDAPVQRLILDRTWMAWLAVSEEMYSEGCEGRVKVPVVGRLHDIREKGFLVTGFLWGCASSFPQTVSSGFGVA